jgi:hypothetical protein
MDCGVPARRLDPLEGRPTVDGPPSRRAPTSRRGRSGPAAGLRTTPAPTTARYPGAVAPLQVEPSSSPPARLVAASSLRATRRNPARRRHAGHTTTAARPSGSRVAHHVTRRGVAVAFLHHRPGPPDGPAVTAKPLRRLDHAAGDPRTDPAPAQGTSAAAMVVGLSAWSMPGRRPLGIRIGGGCRPARPRTWSRRWRWPRLVARVDAAK